MPSAKVPTPQQPTAPGPGHDTPHLHATAPPPPPAAPDGVGVQATVLSNRLLVLMAHTSRYAFRGQSRLAVDAGVSRSTISRLLRGRIASPSYALVCAVTKALETHLGRRLDPRELIAPGGDFPTRSGCALAGCRGCMPDEAYDDEGNLKPGYRHLRPGDWSRVGPLCPSNSDDTRAAHVREGRPEARTQKVTSETDSQTNTRKESR